MYSSPPSANVVSPTVLNFDELESLRLESERFSEDVQALKAQFRSHTYLHALVSRISQKFDALCQNWNVHCETAMDKIEIDRQRAAEQFQAISGKSDSLSSSRRRVNLLELQEHEMEVKEKVLHSTLKNLTSLLRSDLVHAEQALEGQKLMRDMQTYDQNEMLHQVDGDIGDILGVKESRERVADFPRQLIPHPPAKPPQRARPLRPNCVRPRVEVDDSESDLNVTEEFDKVMDELQRQQGQRQVADFNMSLEKSVGGWDSALESETSSPEASLSPNKLKSALMILRKVHLLNNNPDLIRQIENVLNGPDVTQNLELLLQAVKYNGKRQLMPPSDLACTTPKSFRPSDQLFDKTVLSSGRQLFTKDFPGHSEKPCDPAPASEEEENQDMQWEDLMKDSEGKTPAETTPQPANPAPRYQRKVAEGKMKETSTGLGNLSSPRTLRFAQTFLSQQSRELNTKLSPAPLLDHEQSKFMYQLTKRSSTFSTKASSGLKSRMLKGSGDTVLESPYYQPATKAFVMDSS